MHHSVDDLFIQHLKNAACAAAHQADIAAVHDDPETVRACIEAAYAALDEMFELQRLAGKDLAINDNTLEVDVLEA